MFKHGNRFENIVCKTAVISYRSQCVNTLKPGQMVDILWTTSLQWHHKGVMTSQITVDSTVCSNVCSGAHKELCFTGLLWVEFTGDRTKRGSNAEMFPWPDVILIAKLYLKKWWSRGPFHWQSFHHSDGNFILLLSKLQWMCTHDVNITFVSFEK